MRINTHKIVTLFRKDMKDSLQNKNTLIIAVLPVFFAIIFERLYGDMEEAALVYGNMAFYMSVLMTVALMGTTFLSTMVAEEKEKNTLRVLMLSNVSAADFIISKVLVNFVYTEVLCTAIALITAVPAAHLPVLWGG